MSPSVVWQAFSKNNFAAPRGTDGSVLLYDIVLEHLSFLKELY